ncbi:recombinase family protein [Rhodococcus ruber]|uniref:Recombinase family protein n=1 Tax=Rhodococcus ruber TaxID=1830 RepID=A0ABT4MIA4_9NOCA|nr:recombinase family protein [Rhodococcus ruber]MCZ4520725.1 recombinase family protein [Rhodococcus ruber]
MNEQPHMIGYVRVSTEEQADSRLGLQAQEAALVAEASRRGWELTILRDEGLSGSQVNPGLRDALEQLAAGLADGLVVTKLDRMSRSLLHAVEIMERARKQNWALVLLDLEVDTSTASGEAMANMLATFAQFERRLIGERTKAALAAKKAQGVALGRSRQMPTAVARRIVEMRATGQTYGAIARTLTDEQVLSPAGRPVWHESTVRRFCQSVELAKADA